MHRRISSLVVVVASTLSLRAEASLTDSEKMQIATFITKGDATNATRVRALVARPDLSPDEAGEPLKKGFSSVSFDDVHRRFADGLLFGPGSAASRDALVPPLVDALLARAAARMGDVPAEPKGALGPSERAAAEEATAIHAFIDQRIANYGSPPVEGHDAASAIRDDAWRAAALSERAYRDAHARWLEGGAGPLPVEIVRLRTQSALTLIDLSSGVVGRHEVSTWLRLDGVRRDAFERYGVLVQSDAQDSRIDGALRVLESAPGALSGVSLVLLSKTSPAGFATRGTIVSAGVDFGPALHPEAGEKLWTAEVKPSTPDTGLSEIAESTALLAVRRSFAASPELVASARAATERAMAAGPDAYLSKGLVGRALEGDSKAPRAPASAEFVIAGSVKLLLVDAQRALDLALIRAAAGRPQSLEQFATALAVLAGGAKQAFLGRAREDGSIEADLATDVQVADGVATAFVLRGKRYVVLAGKGGAFQATIDGAPPKLTSLSSFEERTAAGESFRAGGVTFTTMFGEPRAAGLDDGRLIVEGSKGGFDALVTGEIAADAEVRARIRPRGLGGGLLLRATPGESSYVAVAFLLSSDPPRARLLTFNGKGKVFEVAEDVSLPTDVPEKGFDCSLRVVGVAVTATVSGKAIAGKLTREVPAGAAGIAVLAGGRVEVSDFKSAPCESRTPGKSGKVGRTPGECSKIPNSGGK